MLSATVSYASSTMGDLVTKAWPLDDSLEDGEFAKIVGIVKDQAGNPVFLRFQLCFLLVNHSIQFLVVRFLRFEVR